MGNDEIAPASVARAEYGPLRQVLEGATLAFPFTRADLTVVSTQVDPYRMDTPSNHRDGAWLGEQLAWAISPDRRIHWRGLHYAISTAGNIIKPNGEAYLNNDDDWEWLYSNAAKAARWLGYIGFDRIHDARNAEPVIHRKARVTPEPWVSVGVDVTVPDVDDLQPYAGVTGFVGRQPYSLAVFGEKTSLEDVVLPIAQECDADLYLAGGEISDTLIYQMAKDGAEDGRPMVVFTLVDFDPAGHQMAVSIGRKLQAFRDLLFPKLEFKVVPVALTIEQVRDLGLPSTPLKPKEKRADRWRTAFGAEQTEIDALATLQPAVLRRIVRAAINPYYDRTLKSRVSDARAEWLAEAHFD